jgi:uncharacterized membrane protein
MNNQGSYQSSLNFSLSDQKTCERAIRNGSIAALVSAGLTAVLATMGAFAQPQDNQLGNLLSMWFFLEVGLILVLGVFTYRKSRIASTVLFLYFVASKLVLFLDGSGPRNASGLLPSIFFFIFFLNAMRATYIWHKKYLSAANESTFPNVDQ